MIFKFLILSDEVDNFKREIEIDSDATFLDLNNAILDSVNFTKDQMTSFFICEEDWSKETEITLIEMDTSSEIDNYVMGDTVLSELLEDEKQKLMFVFDYLTERAFFMELTEIVTGKSLSQATCLQSVGDSPAQVLSMDDADVFSASSGSVSLDESFFGDEEFDLDEIDRDGFDGLDVVEEMGSNPYED